MPTNQEFLDRFPEFAAVGDNNLTAVRQEAEARLDQDALGADYSRAVLLLTAHELVLSGKAPEGIDTSEALNYRHAGVTAAKIGEASLSITSEPLKEFEGTRYGRDLITILDRRTGIRWMTT